jgi:hypothetical protein
MKARRQGEGRENVCRERTAGILVPQATVDPLQNNATLATFSIACRGVKYDRVIRSLFITLSPGAFARKCIKNLEEAHHRVLYYMNKNTPDLLNASVEGATDV